MIRTNKKFFIYSRNRIIYSYNDKSYIRYNKKYLLLNSLKGGGMENKEEQNKGLKKDKDLKKEELLKKEEDLKICEGIKVNLEEVLKKMLNNIIEKDENYNDYIKDLNKDIYIILQEPNNNDIKKKIKDILYDKFFKNYILEIVHDIPLKNITNFIDIEENIDKNEKENVIKTIKMYNDKYKNNFDNFKIYWNNIKDNMCKDNKLIINLDGIKYNFENSLCRKEKNAKEDNIKDDDATKYQKLAISSLKTIIYISLKNDFEKIKSYVKNEINDISL